MKKYCETYQVEVAKIGIIILPLMPWLGCSPDGVVIKNNEITTLVEVKCPYVVATDSLENLIEKKKIFFPQRKSRKYFTK